MLQLTMLQKIIIWALPILFAITVHEVAHGWLANKLGDPTARMLGRITLNPVKHIDLIGTIVVPLALLFLGGFIFGWAKPVPVTWENLKKPKRDMALVALAGPMSNLLMAIVWIIIAKLAIVFHSVWPMGAEPIALMGFAGVMINLILMVLNLFPIPPLDGSRIVSSFLSGRAAMNYNRLEPYGLFILIGLIATGILGKLLWPPVVVLQNLLRGIVGI